MLFIAVFDVFDAVGQSFVGGGSDFFQVFDELAHFTKGVDEIKRSSQFGTLGGAGKKVGKTSLSCDN